MKFLKSQYTTSKVSLNIKLDISSIIIINKYKYFKYLLIKNNGWYVSVKIKKKNRPNLFQYRLVPVRNLFVNCLASVKLWCQSCSENCVLCSRKCRKSSGFESKVRFYQICDYVRKVYGFWTLKPSKIVIIFVRLLFLEKWTRPSIADLYSPLC